MGGMFFLSKGVLYLLKMNIQTISYNVVRCIMHKKDFNKPRNPAFSYANWHWPTTSKHRPIFPVDSHDNLVSRHRYKNWSEKCTVWPIGVVFKSKPNNQSFFSGFSTGFLRLKKNEFFFGNPVFYGLGRVFYAPSKHIISHHRKQIWHWDP